MDTGSNLRTIAYELCFAGGVLLVDVTGLFEDRAGCGSSKRFSTQAIASLRLSENA